MSGMPVGFIWDVARIKFIATFVDDSNKKIKQKR
jgi:hypothetical protein